ncbi:hypothetical protein LTR62_002020 [Meristemomyces frigidus]|uniref:Uncharacterized protein n=1 Tax=Meristemomyces frigidus TaxID=1508187 RepID=A0AAN7TJV2_9PEZI|nr:hypothetical protein LTR62_002020 [Meristemomyces frigidus]
MPPRPRLEPAQLPRRLYLCHQCRHASLATATTPAPPLEYDSPMLPPIPTHSSTRQSLSHKPPEFRKSQLHRQYQSLLRSSPLILLFQHNNVNATEWSGIRRELASALRKVDEDLAKAGDNAYVGESTKLQIVQTGIFASALKVVEFWKPKFGDISAAPAAGGEAAVPAGSAGAIAHGQAPAEAHGLSEEVWRAVALNKELTHGLEPLLSGPIALLTLPTVSPQHLKAAFSILAPTPKFPAPKRRLNPTYHEKPVQEGLQKLMLLGARVEGKVFDMEGARWVGGIEGGMTGLRSQLVGMLGGMGAQITSTLEAAGKSLYFTVEGRRDMLEEEEKKANAGSDEPAKVESVGSS